MSDDQCRLKPRICMTRVSVAALLGCVVATISLLGQQPATFQPDQIFYNGKIVTVDPGNSIQEAFAVKGDRFLAVGTSAAIRAMGGPQTVMVDLNGRTVVPGLTDSHAHPWRNAFRNLRGVDITGVRSLPELTERIRSAAATAPGNRTVYATGSWTEAQLLEKRAPTRAELDAIVSDRPLVVFSGQASGGAGERRAFLNTAALKAARITRETATVYGARNSVPKGPDGEPTGAIIGSTPFPVMTVAARLIPVEDVRALWLQAQHELSAQGFTSIREPQVPVEIMRLYWSLWREGQLTMRVSMGIDVGAGQAEELDDILRPWGVGPRFGDHWLRFDSLGEFAVDGSGLIDSTPALFRRGILTIHRHGWRPAPHIGTEDKYLDQALEAYEAADRDRPIRDERWIVEHVPQTRPDQMDRMARLGVTAVVNLAGYRETGTLIKNYGQARVERIVPVREMLDHRVNVVFGSDWSDGPNNPFVPFYYYTTRKTEDGAALGPAQAITRQEALRLLTMNPAYVTFEETLKGSIEAGKLADFVILSQDVLTVADDRIRATQALETYVGGRRVFAK